MKFTASLLVCFGLLVHSSLAMRGHGRTVRATNRASEKKSLELQQLRRRAGTATYSSGKGKGGKGKTSGTDATATSGEFDEDVLDGTALDDLGTATDGIPLDTVHDPVDDLDSGGGGDTVVGGDETDLDKGGKPVDATDTDGTWNCGDPDGTGNDPDGTDDCDGDSTAGTSDGDTGVVYGIAGEDDLHDKAPDNDPSITLAQCKIDEDEIIEELLEKQIDYFYTVSIDEEASLREVLAWIEFRLLVALSQSNQVLRCSSDRRLEEDLRALRIESKPVDAPVNPDLLDNCQGDDCKRILIQGGLTVSEPDGEDADLTKLECDVLPVLNEFFGSLEEIAGLEGYRFEPIAIPDHCTGAAGNTDRTIVENGARTSDQVPAGLVVGAALGGMCLVLVGLLIVRQGVAKERRDDHGSQITKDTTPIDGSSTLEMTVDANETAMTSKYLSPKAHESGDSTILGISSSPDDCSEWGDGKGPSKIDDDAESPLENKCDPEPSDFTFGDDSRSPMSNGSSIDPPPVASPHDDQLHFEPKVHEEEYLMHDVALADDGDELREGLAEA